MEKNTGARELVSHAVATSPALIRHSGELRRRGGKVEPRGARAGGGGHRRAYRVPPRQASTVVGFVLPAGLIHSDDISGTPSAIHSSRTQLGLAATRIAAEIGRRR